jgi:predicted amidohydrolase
MRLQAQRARRSRGAGSFYLSFFSHDTFHIVMSSETFIAAAVQMCAGDDLSVNLDTCKRLAARAAGAGAELLVLPECFPFLGRHGRDKFAVAETWDSEHPGPILQALQDMATKHGLWVIAGGAPEILEEEAETGTVTRTYISCPVLSPSGDIVSVYRKVHLFDVDIPGGAVQKESSVNAPGSKVVVVETPFARVGLSVCYDLRFPEMYRAMTVWHNAQILVVPAAFTAHTGAAHWHVLLRSRAIENQCFVIAAAQTGKHNDKRESYGHSLIIDPWGTVLGELPEGEGLVMAEIDLALQTKTRTQMPCIEHATFMRSGTVRDDVDTHQ